jgi:hypothetical protein
MAPEDPGDRVALSELAGLLAASLGEDRARATVEGTVRAMGLEGPELEARDAFRVLAQLGEAPGIVGTVARFAKARFILAHPVE